MMERTRTTSLLLAALSLGALLFAGNADAQQFPISTPQISTCTGVLEDSGGPAAMYGNGENFTTVICPDIPGDVISIQWLIWNLSPTGPNPLDRIRVWDGDNTGETFLGEYTGNDNLQGLIISGTTFNTSGCLTVQFISNGGGTGNFAATISCTTPCDRPTAVASMSEAVPAQVCVGEEVTFDGTASFAAAGFNIVDYTWDFDDGSNASGPTSSHSFTEPGEYIVQLLLVDDNDCVNTNVVDLAVQVSTTPDFTGTVDDFETCLGSTVVLNAQVEPTTWTDLPESNFGEPLDLPDDVGIPFSSSLEFTQFDPGQTLTDVNDLLSICVSMEHTYMGDLVLMVTCPNGQTVAMHQQGGANTFLGDANDMDGGGNIVPGTCFDYCWSPTATNGTWEENSEWGTSPNTVPVSQGNALAPGTYESVQPLSGFEGCPLNGAWTFTSTDIYAADNGTICSWSINFDPSIIPDLSQFTPVLGTDIDSAGWSGPVLVVDPANPLSAIATPSGPGEYVYSFYVTDNFGCSYDTTVTVTIDPPMEVEAGPDIILCNDPEPMAADITANEVPGAVYEWTPTDGLSDPYDAQADVFVLSPTWFYVAVYPNGSPECAVIDSVLVSPDPSIDAGEDAVLTVCANDPVFLMTDSLAGTPDAGGVWTEAAGAVVPEAFDPNVDQPGIYTYTVTSAAGCEAAAELDITVIPSEDPTCCGIADAGEPAYSCNLTIDLNATPGNTGVGEWSGPAGAVFGNIYDTQTTVTMPAGEGGTHRFYWTEDDGAFCYLRDSVDMTFTDEIVITFTTTDAICYTYCDGTAMATVTGGNAAVALGYSWSTGEDGPALTNVEDLCAGDHSLTVTDDNGCFTTTPYTIGQPVLLEIDSLASQPVTCSGDCDGQVEIYDAEAVEYSFNDGASWSTDPIQTLACEAIYPIQIRNVAGCIGTGSITVTGPPPVVAAFEWGPIPANVDNPFIMFKNTTTGAQEYVWDIAGLLTTTEVDPTFTFNNKEPDTYPVCLVANNYNNCLDTICHDVIIDDVLFTYIPTAFSPDGDGVNDKFLMSTNIGTISDFEMFVFDRWGQIVYKSTNPNEAWAGNFQNGGEILSTGVYAYRILFEIDETQARKELVGYVTLVK